MSEILKVVLIIEKKAYDVVFYERDCTRDELAGSSSVVRH